MTTSLDAAALSAAIALFNERATREKELWDARENIALDLRLARRENDEQGIAAAQEAQRLKSSEWHAALIEARDALKALIDLLGVDLRLFLSFARQLNA